MFNIIFLLTVSLNGAYIRCGNIIFSTEMDT